MRKRASKQRIRFDKSHFDHVMVVIGFSAAVHPVSLQHSSNTLQHYALGTPRNLHRKIPGVPCTTHSLQRRIYMLVIVVYHFRCSASTLGSRVKLYPGEKLNHSHSWERWTLSIWIGPTPIGSAVSTVPVRCGNGRFWY